MATNLAGYRSWFNGTVYKAIEELQRYESDSVFSVLGEMNYDTSTGDTVSFTSRAYGGFAPVVTPGGAIPESNPTEGDQLSRQFFSIKDKLIVEWESYKHNKMDFVLDDISSMIQRCNNTPALVLSGALLTFADSSTITMPGSVSYSTTCADGQTFASASHTVAGTGSTTYSNVLSGGPALSLANISAAIQQGNQVTVNDDGVVAPWNPDTIIIPNNELMVAAALQITGSKLVLGSNNNNINIYEGGRFRVVVLKHAPRTITGTYDTTTSKMYRWMLADSKMLKRGFKYGWAAKPSENVLTKFASRENFDSVMAVAGRMVFAIPRWQGTMFSISSTAPTIV